MQSLAMEEGMVGIFFPPHLEPHNHQTWVSGILSFFTLLQDSLLAEMLGPSIPLPFFSLYFLPTTALATSSKVSASQEVMI